MPQICTPSELAANIRERLTANGSTVKKMLDALHLGINTISQIDAGRYPRVETLFNIAEYLGCTVNDLLYRPEKSDD